MLASSTISTPRSISLRGRLPSLAAAAGIAVHVLVAAWVFAPALWGDSGEELVVKSWVTLPPPAVSERAPAALLVPLLGALLAASCLTSAVLGFCLYRRRVAQGSVQEMLLA